MIMNKGGTICCKAVTTQVFTLVGLIVGIITSIEKPKVYLEAYISVH